MKRHQTANRQVLLSASVALLLLSISVAAQRVEPTLAPAVVPEKLKGFVPVTDDMLLRPRPENWISFRNGYNLWGYSALNQINAGNVQQLRLVWSRAMQPGPQEVEPLVYDGIMFLANAEDVIQALDATTGDLLWEYRRKLPPEIGRLTGTNYRYRNVSIYDDKIFLATNDAFQIALEAKSGHVLWESRRADYKDQVAQTTGPIVVKGKLLNGSRCNPSSPLPGGCFITAHDAQFGEPVWRVNVIARPGEPGGDTWGGLPLAARRHASAWMPGSYDPELNLVYWGTGVTAPVPEKLRGAGKADLLYTNSTLAINPDTGQLVWYFQHLPRDNWDLDHPFERMIVETTVAPSPDEVPWISPKVRSGETRKVITGIPGKTGVIWTLDARTGEFLWARPTIYQNIMTGVDVQTGRPIINEDSTPQSVAKPSFACPHALGGKNQPSGAYSPDTGAIYMPMNNTCMDISMSVEKATPAAGYGMTTKVRHVPGTDPATAPVGRLQAVSVSTGKTLWTYQQRAPIYGSVLATRGNLIFSGDVVRRFRAFNAESGTMLWETILNGAVSGRPMTYSVGGRQYLAIAAGGVTQATGILEGLTPELNTPRTGNTLFVFALPEQAR
ncbi:MAG: pyrroloquinoline quinone-dependent dehydrogenase [Vicinamibacterales bacterium]